MQYRVLGDSDLRISAVTFGAWAIGGLFWGGSDEADAIAAMQRGIGEGCTSIDTAPMYGCGYSEELVGRAIKGRRSEVQVLTKFGLRWATDEGSHYFDIKSPEGKDIRVHKVATKKSVAMECENSLKRLGIDCIDLYQHHWPDPVTPIEETFAAVAKLIEQGKVRWAGASNYSPEQLAEARKVCPIISNQPPYSMIRRDTEKAILPWCREHNIGVIVYSPLQMGLLTGKVGADRTFPETDVRSKNKFYSVENRKRVNAFLEKTIKPVADAHGVSIGNVVIAWTIAQPGITAALVGARDAAQAAENARGGSLKLDKPEINAITVALDDLELDL